MALLRIPADRSRRKSSAAAGSPSRLKELGYPRRAETAARAAREWFVQEAADGPGVLRVRRVAARGAETAAGGHGDLDPRRRRSAGPGPPAAPRRCGRATRRCSTAHAAWWKKFWVAVAGRIPCPTSQILRHYYLVQYFYGAASRRGAPPMPLQGVWTADAGALPPWKGDYHNDLNTQMTYIAYQAAGHFDEGLRILDFIWDLLPVFASSPRSSTARPALAVPGVMSLAGQPLARLGAVQPLADHGRLDRPPVLPALALHGATSVPPRARLSLVPRSRRVLLAACCSPTTSGMLKLPLSASPEIFDNSLRAWLQPNSNYDLVCLQMFFLALAEMAGACGEAGRGPSSGPTRPPRWASSTSSPTAC